MQWFYDIADLLCNSKHSNNLHINFLSVPIGDLFF